MGGGWEKRRVIENDEKRAGLSPTRGERDRGREEGILGEIEKEGEERVRLVGGWTLLCPPRATPYCITHCDIKK